MREQHVLDLARVDVVAAADQHVVLAVEDVDEAVLVHAPDVAGMQPAVAEGLGRRLGAVPVIGHELGAATDDLAALAHRHRLVVFVENRHVHGRVGAPARAHPVVILRLEAGDDHGRFGLAVGLSEDRTEAGQSALQQARRDRRCAVADALEAEVCGLDRRVLQDHRKHGGHEEGVGRALARSQIDKLGGAEVRHDERVRAPHQGGQEECAARVCDRRRVEEAVARREVGHQIHEEGRELRRLAQRRERDGLGRPGRPAGEAEAQGRLEVAIHAAGPGRSAVDEAAEGVKIVDHRHIEAVGTARAVVDQAACAAIGELVAVILLRLADVEGDPHEARLGERVVGDEAVDSVGQQHADPVARLETLGQQRVAQPIRRRVERAEAERPLALGQRRRVAIHECRAADEFANLHEARSLRRVEKGEPRR